ncbi:MAG TPA: sodium-dependent transporter [bacterium]|nr:sodium-dependent transporter [bacterium]HOL47042.1 sodium-dependent transporter [bacterium]HPQ17953.1 sodium-dependent transporter [bacterium]
MENNLLSENRERWSTRFAFIMAAIGSAVGLGNLWRFPFIAYKNGGGAFLIPYFLALFTAGIPLMILEYGIGQLFQEGPPQSIEKIRKNFKFVGWWAILIALIISIYYAIVMAWCWVYTYFSFSIAWKGIEKQFFFEKFLNLLVPSDNNPFTLGSINFKIVIGLAITWLSVYFIIYKGVVRVGKVVMITVPLPIILLILLFIRSATLNGAGLGIKYYLTPDWSKLLNPRVWLDAYSQIFFSLSLGCGIMISYASYQAKKSEIVNNAFLTSIVDAFTAFFAGFVVFSTIGFFSFQKNIPIENLPISGPGLAFITYPAAIATLPGGNFIQSIFGIIFFLTLLSLGIDSLFSLVEGVITSFLDEFKIFNRKFVTMFFCFLCFICGLLFTTQAGLIWLDIVDHWMTNFGLVIIGLLNCLLIGYFYDIVKFRQEISENSEIKLARWWDDLIRIVIPSVLFILILLTAIEEFKKPYEGYPSQLINIIGWGLVFLLISLSFILAKFWYPFIFIIIGLIFFSIFKIKFDTSVSLMAAFGFSVLTSSFIICFLKAIKNKNNQ